MSEAGPIELAGGKASTLGELIRRGERVPPGFVVTTRAYRLGVLPEDEIVAAYQAMGAGPVAVRSSATAEDLPDAGFAGQYETVLEVDGAEQVLAAVAKCWESLHAERALAYRSAHDLDSTGLRMAAPVTATATAAPRTATARPGGSASRSMRGSPATIRLAR